MLLQVDRRIGKQAMLLVLNEEFENDPDFNKQIEYQNWRFCTGKVGSMDSHKVVAAIETAAKKNGIIKADYYRESHALYHAILEAFHGVTRGQVQLGTILRTVGLRFALVRGNPYNNEEEGEWLAVALYGTIGAPVKGLEHETIGLGVNHI